MRHRLTLTGWLTIVWIGLWGDLSWANMVGGVVVGAATVAAFSPPDPLDLRIRPLHLIRFLVHFARNLVHASAEVAWTVMRPNPTISEAVIAVPLVASTRGVTLVVAGAISLTPGTLVIDTRQIGDDTVLYVHVLDLRDRAKTTAAMNRLEQLASAAFAPARRRTDTEGLS